MWLVEDEPGGLTGHVLLGESVSFLSSGRLLAYFKQGHNGIRFA